MNTARYWKHPSLPGMELCLADHAAFSYGRHVHLDYHIGLVESGAQKFIHKGSSAPLAAGRLSLLNPDIAHDGGCFDERGFRVRVFSIAPELMASLANELEQPLPFFGQPLLDHPDLYRQSLALHRRLEQGWLDCREAESQQLSLLSAFFPQAGNRPLATDTLLKIRERLLAEPALPHSLTQLADEQGLSRFQFLRRFKAAVGITPHAYLKRLRLETAKKYLASGATVADTAQAVGFFDQAHFHRAFVAAYRITPARFRSQMQ
ncbi:AraC family transcriptional regulator [Zobellella maritima]|uniref:AraC family transcriptional regulator n=1 Tax=Zobellella maritima TaxID=2059725 RepID=UPI000E30A3E9|nr:AraC family transcriptional regulator [Zobellella maritima]